MKSLNSIKTIFQLFVSLILLFFPVIKCIQILIHTTQSGYWGDFTGYGVTFNTGASNSAFFLGMCAIAGAYLLVKTEIPTKK
ncbi:hypothetical protein [Solitalea lacus]|uniref:hypothetical protein n=1 Tax=Solitalea lacus TaxID=2911172 RepID=UPI001EDB4CBE|nr:hypothetical protein [Solitalea lacus]UKJ06815.1 hypothetical protein L2B55_14910 [Solitalea lacus]